MLRKFLLFTFIFSIVFCTVSAAQEDDPILARAGDYVFRQSDFERLVSYSPPYLEKQLQKNPAQKEMLIRRIMQQKIFADMARKEGLDEEANVKEQLQYMVNGFLSGEYIAQFVKKNVTVTEDDLKQYYKDNKKQFEQPEQVSAKHILIKVPFGMSEDKKKKAKEKAENILGWLKNGEKFEILAEQYSEDTDSKKRGGNLGYFPRGRMAKPFDEAVFSMKPGEISNVVETDYGYHIIQLDDYREARTKTFEEVKDSIQKQLTDQMSKAKAEELIKKATEEAGLELFSYTVIEK